MGKWYISENGTAGTENKNGGTVLNGGTVGTGVKMDSLTVPNALKKSRTFVGSRIVARTGTAWSAGVAKAVSAGTIAYNPASARESIMLGYGTTIGGVANTTLRSPSADFGTRRAINRFDVTFEMEQTEKWLRNGHWNYVSGAWINPPAAVAVTINADDEANPSRSEQGEFTYMDGSPNPKAGDYGDKTG